MNQVKKNRKKKEFFQTGRPELWDQKGFHPIQQMKTPHQDTQNTGDQEKTLSQQGAGMGKNRFCIRNQNGTVFLNN